MKRALEGSCPIHWTLIQVEKGAGKTVGEEMPAQVPGDVFSDLLRAGKIPDPYIGLNSNVVQWVNDYNWLYKGRADLETQQDKRTWLEFMGLDYRYSISWNGKQLVRSEGMFSRVLLEVMPRTDAPDLIEVHFSTLRDHWSEKWFSTMIVNTEPVRRKHLKTQMSFGWDFAPRLKGCGIWDEVSLFKTGPIIIEDIHVKAGTDGVAGLEITMDSSIEAEAALDITISGETFSGQDTKKSLPVSLKKGKNLISHNLRVEQPKLWHSWDQGRPELYRLSVEALIGGEVSDSVSEVFGFRDISWARNPGSSESSLDWTLLINGNRVFMRGANVVPPDSMPGRLDDERCLKLIEMARGANLNTIRLWGGGNRERSVIYDACDRLGILVWQEFPIACINLGLPRSRRYLDLLRRECSEIVQKLRNHPSVIMWCGGNEFNVHLSRPAIKVMRQVCKELDPTRRFVPASPYRGDAHNWLVWHIKGNLSDYFSDKSQLVSEFGLQAVPDVESLRKFLPGKLLWPIGKSWTHHHLGRGKMEKYVKHFGGPGDSLEDYVNASQNAQAYYLHRGIEHWRRQKYEKSGALFWQWNDPWPCISWSVVDYYLKPKLAYEAIKHACAPLLVSAEFEQKRYGPGDAFSARIVIVNDLPRDFSDLEVQVKSRDNVVKTLRGSVDADQVANLGEVSFIIPEDGKPSLELIALEQGQELSRNCYDLTLHDPKSASFIGRRLFKRLWQFLSE